jgi:pterin-4a-carbinolamine dehydratase
VKLELSRFDVGGKVTDRDLEVAKKINETYATENKL